MAPTWSVKLPDFHGDSSKLPHESWEDYETSLQLTYDASGIANIDDVVRRAHVLTGLQGRAKQVLRLNPQWKNLPYLELLQQLRKKFGKPSWRNLEEIGKVIQKPRESVLEFLARLRESARATETLEEYPVVTKQEAKTIVGENSDLEAIKKAKLEKEQQMYSRIIDRFIFKYFVKGLRPDIRASVATSNPKNLSDAIEKAEDYEKYADMFDDSNIYLANLSIAGTQDKSDTVVDQAGQTTTN